MVKICTDSCVDINKNQIFENNISIIPLCVILGEDEYFDGVNITPKEIFDYVKKRNQLPKTSARSVEDLKEFFKSQLDGDSEVVYLGISGKLSSTYENALRAKEELQTDKLFIVDSKSLSTGIGLLVLYGCQLAEKGLTGKKIAQILTRQADFVQASFVVDKLDYLYKGGRCSAMARFGANLLKIKPRLELIDGKIENTGKYMGKFQTVIYKYIDDMLAIHSNMKKDLCFITHTCPDEKFVADVVKYVKDKNIFKEVVSSVAGSTISCHCGENTLGILYLLEEK